ncbi:MAG TPA: hypothetical protein PKH79_14250, partial [Prolixibacteraceae bacterium]|nr:hypothetical protein [Prolixibacteraceae bacterium]
EENILINIRYRLLIAAFPLHTEPLLRTAANSTPTLKTLTCWVVFNFFIMKDLFEKTILPIVGVITLFGFFGLFLSVIWASKENLITLIKLTITDGIILLLCVTISKALKHSEKNKEE